MKLAPWLFFLAANFIALLAGKIFDLDEVSWRSVETAAIALGGIGLVAAIGESQRVVPTNRLSYLRPRTRAASDLLGYHLEICRNICELRIAHISDAQDPELNDYKRAADWYKKGRRFLEQNQRDEFPSLSSWILEHPSDVQSQEVQLFVADTIQSETRYRAAQQEYIKVKEATERNTLEDAAALISPYLITIALALSLFKALYSQSEH